MRDFRMINPAAQASTKAISYVGSPTASARSFHVKCLDWVWLSPAAKLANASIVGVRNKTAIIPIIDDYCNRNLESTRPAGQVYNDPAGGADMTFDVDSSGNATTVTGRDGTIYSATDTTIPGVTPPATQTVTPVAGTGLGSITAASAADSAHLFTPAQQTQLFSAIGGILNTTGAGIAAVIQSNNQMQLAQLQAQTQIEIAKLTSQSQQSMSAGNQTLAQQQAAQAAMLQQFQAMLAGQQQSKTPYYVMGAVGVLMLIGGVIIFASKPSPAPVKQARSTRSTSRSRR